MTVSPPLYVDLVECGVSPWRVLRDRPDVVLRYGWLRNCKGMTVDHGAFYEVVLDCRLTQTERRCVLAHELCHLGRPFYDRQSEPRLVAKIESAVDREVAGWLCPADELERFVNRLVDNGDPVTVATVSSEFNVTAKVAGEAMSLLRQQLTA